MPNTQSGRLFARLTNVGLSSVTGYFLEYDGAGGLVYFGRQDDDSTLSYITGNRFHLCSAGDKLALICEGSHFEAWRDTGSGWEIVDDGLGNGEDSLAKWDDATYSNAGYLGIINQNNTVWTIDDFGGGTLVETVPLGYQRLYGPAQLGTSAADLYTAPAGTLVEIRRISISNPSGGTIKPTLSIGADAASTRVIELQDIVAGGEYDGRRGVNHTLVAGETIQGKCDTAATAVIVIDGYLEGV